MIFVRKQDRTRTCLDTVGTVWALKNVLAKSLSMYFPLYIFT